MAARAEPRGCQHGPVKAVDGCDAWARKLRAEAGASQDAQAGIWARWCWLLWVGTWQGWPGCREAVCPNPPCQATGHLHPESAGEWREPSLDSHRQFPCLAFGFPRGIGMSSTLKAGVN